MIRATHTTFFFFFNDTATTEIYTLSLHDALPISFLGFLHVWGKSKRGKATVWQHTAKDRVVRTLDRKSTRLNSSHGYISYAVFCLKKKKTSHVHILACTTDSCGLTTDHLRHAVSR